MITRNSDCMSKSFLRRRVRGISISIILVIVLLFLSGAMLMFGNTKYSWSVVLKVLLGNDIEGASFAISTLRLPRMLAGVLAGFAFGMAGNTFQTMLRNPLASPDIIGVTSGSSVAAVFCMLVLNLSGSIVSIIAVVSGFLVAISIYLLSRGGSFSGGRLILIGIGVQAMMNATISFLLLKASQYDVPGAMRWLSGSLNGMQMDKIPALLLVVIVAGCVIYLLASRLKILELGDQSAISLGLKTDQTRLMLVISSVFLIAFATAVTGPIAFVAFLAGPIAKKMVGASVSHVLPAGLVGAILVLSADLIGQFAFDTKFPVGVVTGIIGAPYLILLLIQMNRKGESA